MTKRLPKEGELIMTANWVSGYDEDPDRPISNQLAIVIDARPTADRFEGVGQVVKVRLLATNQPLVLFEDEYIYPDEEQSDGTQIQDR